MKNIKTVLVISVVVLGFGTVNYASATNHSVENSLQQTVTDQSKQVTLNLTEQLKQSIKLSVKQMQLVDNSNDKALLTVASSKAKLTNKNNLSAEEE